MQAGLALWLPQWREACVHDRTSDSQPLSLCSLSYPARINAAKILTELQQYDVNKIAFLFRSIAFVSASVVLRFHDWSLLQTAGEILELLLDEEDEVAEVSHLYDVNKEHASLTNVDLAEQSLARF